MNEQFDIVFGSDGFITIWFPNGSMVSRETSAKELESLRDAIEDTLAEMAAEAEVQDKPKLHQP